MNDGLVEFSLKIFFLEFFLVECVFKGLNFLLILLMGFVKFFGLFFKCLNGFLGILKDFLFGQAQFLEILFLLLENFDGITKFDSLCLQFSKLMVRFFQLR